MSFSAKPPEASHKQLKRVVIVVYPDVTLLDAAGPSQAFSSANTALRMAGDVARYEVVLASPAGGQVVTDTGIGIHTLALGSASAQPIDTLIVAGGLGVFDLIAERRLIQWIVARSRDCRRIASTCMGAFLLAEAGLLDGKTVTTHWRHTEALQQRYPNVTVEVDPLFLHDGKMWSAAGVTAGIDMALAMIEEDIDHDIAMQVAQALVVFLKRPGGQSQFSNVLVAQTDDNGGTFSGLHAWIASNLHAHLGVDTLAKRAGMSARTFARTYKERTGATPAKAVEMMRVEAAKRLLENGTMAQAKIARQTGLVDEQRLRRTFLRHVCISPTEYRRKFSAGSGRKNS